MDDFFCRQQLRTHPYTLFCWILMILVKSTLQETLSPIVPSIEPIYSNESFNFNVLMVRRFLKDDINEPQVIINRVFSSPFYDNDEQPNDNLDGLSHISFDSKRNDIPNYSDDIVFNQSTGDSSHEFVLFNYTDPSSPLWPSIPPFSPSPASSSSSNNETVFTLTPLETVYQYNWFYLFLGLLVFVGVFGNILVCLAIILERRLQNATNYFLLSLAIADLLVSILVMPMSIVNEVYGYWPFGTLTCNLWVTCDVLCCSSSIYHMCFISVGRYIGIKNPLHARQARLLVSRRAVLFKIVIVWLIAALITSPITILGVIDNTNVMPEPQVCCINNNYFIIIGAFSAFYLPMIIMVNSYVLTVRLLRRKAKFCKNSSDHGKWPPSRTSTSERSHGDHGDHGDDGRYSGNEKYHRREFDSKEPKSGFNTKTRSLHSISDGNGDFPRRSNTNHSGTKRLSATSSILRGHFGAEVRTKANKRYNTQPMMIRTLGSSVQVRTEQKATQVLGLVFFLFIICWSPFFTRNLVEALFTDFQMPSSLPTIFLWLGYFSSTINPVIYTIFNRNFRRAFRRIILCQTIKYRLQRSQQSFTPNQRLGARRVISRNSKNNNNNNNSSNSNNNNNNNNNNNHNNGDNSNNNVMNFHDYVYRRPGRIKRSGRMLDQTRESYDDSIDGDGRARHSEVLMRSQSNPIESGDPRHNHGSHSDDFGNYTDQLTMAYYWQFQSSAVSENQI